MSDRCLCTQAERVSHRPMWVFRLAQWSKVDDPQTIRVCSYCDRPIFGLGAPVVSAATVTPGPARPR